MYSQVTSWKPWKDSHLTVPFLLIRSTASLIEKASQVCHINIWTTFDERAEITPTSFYYDINHFEAWDSNSNRNKYCNTYLTLNRMPYVPRNVGLSAYCSSHIYLLSMPILNQTEDNYLKTDLDKQSNTEMLLRPTQWHWPVWQKLIK